MGTSDPLVHIEAATLAGGDKNQDRYAYGDGWAFVLDGASSFSEAPPVHDGGWYAERLKDALAARLEADRDLETTKIIEQAICEASAGHELETQGLCPTSTIAMARWSEGELETYLLGDSRILWADMDRTKLITDERQSKIGASLREKYRLRLAQGLGFDLEHQQILARLQAEQARNRNSRGGYWIAGDDPLAARHGLLSTFSTASPSVLLLASDGLTIESCMELLNPSRYIEEIMERVCREEESDRDGLDNPRSKRHDDKTAIRITWFDRTIETINQRGGQYGSDSE